jgi:hypothetical protein
MAETQAKRAEAPRYRLTEKCYLNERMYDPDEMPFDQMAEANEDGSQPRKPLVITFAGVPAYYMEPMNDAARAMCEKHANRMHFLDPINSLHIVTPAAAEKPAAPASA